MSVLDNIRKLAEEVMYPPAPVDYVIPTRYPYTYSADFLRSHSEIIPDKYLKIHELSPGQPLSRSQAAGIKSGWAKDLGVDERELASIFADAYLKENNIVWRETPAS